MCAPWEEPSQQRAPVRRLRPCGLGKETSKPKSESSALPAKRDRPIDPVPADGETGSRASEVWRTRNGMRTSRAHRGGGATHLVPRA